MLTTSSFRSADYHGVMQCPSFIGDSSKCKIEAIIANRACLRSGRYCHDRRGYYWKSGLESGTRFISSSFSRIIPVFSVRVIEENYKSVAIIPC